MKTTVLSSIGLLAGLATAAVEADWSQRSIYQLMTDRFALSDGSTDKDCDLMKYCGGTWKGIINKLDYIQDMGFTAVQISPHAKNLPQNTPYGEAYHGYWVQDGYALNENFGTADDLNDLIDELHNRDMYLVLDVVINNVAVAINGSMEKPQNIDYSEFFPFNDKKYFHPYCNITDYDDDEIAQKCWLGQVNVALPDLDTSRDDVKKLTDDWIKSTIQNFSVDALRVDAAKHVDTPFLAQFTKATNVFTMGEVYSGIIDKVCPYEEDLQGLPNYPVWFPFVQAFTAGKMDLLADMVSDVQKGCKGWKTLGTFMENHDIPRFASYTPDMALAQNAMAYTILGDGIPMVYMGQEQHFKGNYSPYNREALWTSNYDTDAPLYQLAKSLNMLRNHAIKIDSRYTDHSKPLYVDPATYATSKGPDGVQIVAVFSNQGEKGGKYTMNMGGFAPNAEVMDILECERQTANNKGNITVQMGKGVPKVYFPVAQLNGSGLCGFKSDASTSSGSSNSTNSTDDGDKKNAGEHVQMHLPTLALCVVLAFASWLL